MATAAELINLQKAILRRTDAGAAEAQAAAGTTVAQYTEALLKQAESSTIPALVVFEHVFGKTQSEASLDTPQGGADFAAKQYVFYRDALKVANPAIGAYEAFGKALADSGEFHALSDGRSTLQFITEQYDAILGPAVANGTLTAGIRSAGIAALVTQVEYFTSLYLSVRAPNGEFISPADALNQARAAVMGQVLGIAATTPSLGLTLISDAKAFLTAAAAGTAVFEAPFEATLGGPGGSVVTLTVQQVLGGTANGKHYILADRLEKILANPDVMKNADSYKLTNAIGGVGAVTVEGAKVLFGATNANNFDYSLADTGAEIKAASSTIIGEADTIAVIGSKSGETLDFSHFSRGVILNGSDGSDILRGTKFNDVYYGGEGTNSYYSNGGADTLRLSDSGADFIFLTRSAAGGLTSGPMHIYGFGAGDKFVLSNADFSTNMEGSWTKDDYYESEPLMKYNAAGNMYFSGVEAHTIALFQIDSYWSATNHGHDGSSLFKLLQANNYYTKITNFEMSTTWKGLFAFDDYDTNNTYIYYADSGADTLVSEAEVKLVAILHDTLLISLPDSYMV